MLLLLFLPSSSCSESGCGRTEQKFIIEIRGGNLHCTEPRHFWMCSDIGIMQLRHSQHALGLMFALMSTTGIRAAAVATRMSLDDTRSCDSVQVSWRVSAKRMTGRAQEHGLHMPILSAPLLPRPAEIATCGLSLTHFTCAGLPPQLHQAHWRHPPAPLKVLFLSVCHLSGPRYFCPCKHRAAAMHGC